MLCLLRYLKTTISKLLTAIAVALLLSRAIYNYRRNGDSNLPKQIVSEDDLRRMKELLAVQVRTLLKYCIISISYQPIFVNVTTTVFLLCARGRAQRISMQYGSKGGSAECVTTITKLLAYVSELVLLADYF